MIVCETEPHRYLPGSEVWWDVAPPEVSEDRRRSWPGANTSVSVPSSSASTTRERLAAGETLVGAFLNLGSAVAAEVCARSGFDWLLVDLEHGAGTEAELIPALQAIGGRCTSLVRVEANERLRFARALDTGADGVMVPRVDSPPRQRTRCRACATRRAASAASPR